MTAVFVLGGAGFIGRGVMSALLKSDSYSPIAGLHRPPTVAFNFPYRPCDGTNRQSIADAIGDSAFAINCVLGSRTTMISATRNLCDVASQRGVKRLVHISTMSVYGDGEGIFDEVIAPSAKLSRYGAAKLECEYIVRDWMDRTGNEAVILRPGIVYGPGGQQWVGRICGWLYAGRLGDLGAAGDGFCNLLHVNDMAKAAVAAISVPAAAGETFNLATPVPLRWNDVFLTIARAIGAVPVKCLSSRRLTFESSVMAPFLQAARLGGAKLGVKMDFLPEAISPSLCSLFGQQIRLNVTKAERTFTFPWTDDATGLTESARWFQKKLAYDGACLA